MAIDKALNKLFVRVSGVLTSDQRETLLKVESKSEANKGKIYFLEKTYEIVNNGVAYGINPDDKQLITNLQHWVGSDTDKPANVSTMLERLTALEGIHVAVTGVDSGTESAYLQLTDDTGEGSSVQPLITLKIKDITSSVHGLVDNQNAKAYIDAEAAKATTKLENANDGVIINTSVNSDGSNTYKIGSNLTLKYVAATPSDPAHIQLNSADANDTSYGRINVSDIIGNGVLNDTSYNKNTNELTLYFETATGEDHAEVIDLKELIDINDVFIGTDSTNYLTVTNNTSTATFDTKMKDVSTASATATGLADAWQVKQYVDSKTLDLAVSANGDTYVSADVSANNNKHIVVSTNIQNLVANAGTRGTWTVSETDGTATLTGETDPTLTGTAGKLIDSAETATQVKTYVNAKVAQEASERQARIEAAIKSLDANITSTNDTNTVVTITEVDGKLTAATVTNSYATVSTNGTGSDATFAVTSGDEAKLVKASDLTKLQTYVDEQLAGALDSLDATVNNHDASSYIDFTVNEENGRLKDASIAVTYGTLSGADVTHGHHTGTEGIATTQVVADFVDGYDYWTTYTPA